MLPPKGVVPEPTIWTEFWPTGPVQEREVVFDPSRFRITMRGVREQVAPADATRERETIPNWPFWAVRVTVALAVPPGPTVTVEGLGTTKNPGGGTIRVKVGPTIASDPLEPVTLNPKI